MQREEKEKERVKEAKRWIRKKSSISTVQVLDVQICMKRALKDSDRMMRSLLLGTSDQRRRDRGEERGKKERDIIRCTQALTLEVVRLFVYLLAGVVWLKT